MIRLLFISLLLSAARLDAQLSFSSVQVELGDLGAVYEIAGDVVIKNNGEEKIHLMRADAEKGMKVFTSRRTLMPGDTALLIISFFPGQKGKFRKTVTLHSSGEPSQQAIVVTGNVAQVKENDLTACYYFGSGRMRRPRAPMESVVAGDNTPTPVSTPGELGRIRRPVSVIQAEPRPARTSTPAVQKPAGELAGHVPNNIVILLDISSSMRDSLKLPVLKKQMHVVVDAIREMDSVSLVTYADTVKVRYEAVSGSEKQRLHEVIESLKARGSTKGRKAILFSQELAQKHFIAGGNNMIILASDGKFTFQPDDQALFSERQSKGRIVISTVAIGDDKEAHRTLKQIAQKGQGSFIQVRRSNDTGQLLAEIRERSAPQNKR